MEQRAVHGVLPALAVALVVAGTATVGYAGWVLPRDLVPAGPAPTALRAWTIGLGVAAVVVAMAGWWLRRRGDGPATRTPFVLVPALAAAGGVAVLGLISAEGLREQEAAGFVGTAAATVAWGAVLAVLGWLLAAVALSGRGGRWPRAFGVVLVLVVALVAGAGAGVVALVAPDVGLRATTATRVAGGPLPQTVSGVSWTATAPTPVRAVLAAGPGVVLRLDDGVQGIDGTTGEVRWSYRRPGAITRSADLDGARRLLRLTWSAGEGGATTSVVLDARSGRERSGPDAGPDAPVRPEPPSLGSLDGDVVVLLDPDGAEVGRIPGAPAHHGALADVSSRVVPAASVWVVWRPGSTTLVGLD